MPAALMRVCAANGCPNLVTSGRCASCQKVKQQAYDDRRGSAASRGYGSKWTQVSKGLRRGKLRWCGDTIRGYPTGDSACPQEGLGRVPSDVVDHIEPVNGPNDPKFWDRNNWGALCHGCHNRKRQRESQTHRRSW